MDPGAGPRPGWLQFAERYFGAGRGLWAPQRNSCGLLAILAVPSR
jgi:hypothetical protein